MTTGIPGFLPDPKDTATGEIYKGRFTCGDVQWTGNDLDTFATFTVTAEQIADAADSNILWTDQDVQRGILPGLQHKPLRELPLSAGYPDPNFYIFSQENADDMVEKLLAGERLFLSPLVWNLRPGTFECYWDKTRREIYIYSGRIYLPDSHHRQQAIRKAVHLWRETKSSYPKFAGSRQFKVEMYFLTREDEGNYFFDKNQRPKPTAKSKAYDLTTLDDLSLLAKEVISKSEALRDNVNRVTDRLTAKNPQVVTLSTLREMMRTFAARDYIDKAEMQGLAQVAATFYDLLAEVRPELAHTDATQRRRVRDTMVVDSAVMMHGYAAVMKDFNDAIAKLNIRKASDQWRKTLSRLGKSESYKIGNWKGEIFDKHNPLWLKIGVTRMGRDGVKLTVLNTGAARGEAGRALRLVLSLDPSERDLSSIVEGA